MIIFLGAAVFSGLRNTPYTMAASADAYLNSHNLGFLAIARAIATRCCSPPDNCAGKLSLRPPSPTRSRISNELSGSLEI